MVITADCEPKDLLNTGDIGALGDADRALMDDLKITKHCVRFFCNINNFMSYCSMICNICHLLVGKS